MQRIKYREDGTPVIELPGSERFEERVAKEAINKGHAVTRRIYPDGTLEEVRVRSTPVDPFR
jgi:hypothetical protein